MLRIEYFDKERFMRQLSASHGSVLLHLDNGKTCDLKKDATARSMLQMMDTAPNLLDDMVYVTLAVRSSLDRRRENSGFTRQ